ncbi:MAG TPA: hypothetical protein ENK57_21515 [Polyangiaceae bacterium]|nr:hypothetical protein [Polyangiaceae bacterium]
MRAYEKHFGARGWTLRRLDLRLPWAFVQQAFRATLVELDDDHTLAASLPAMLEQTETFLDDLP